MKTKNRYVSALLPYLRENGIRYFLEYKFNSKRDYRLDVYIPRLKWGIEFNGFFHALKQDIDLEKKLLARKKGIEIMIIHPSGKMDRNKELIYPKIINAIKTEKLPKQEMWA